MIHFFLCPGLDSNQHARSAQPPQDCMSTNFTTRAGVPFEIRIANIMDLIF